MKVVVIPATYNEKGNIEKLITIFEEEVFPKIKNHEMHILVADDNSPDGTADAVKELMKKWKNLNVNSGEKKGLGAAYVRAMSYAIEKMDADIVCSIDADLSHDPRSLVKFMEKIDKGYDIVIGTRYSEGGSMPENWPLIRKLYSVTANLIIRIITGRFGTHDWTGGYRAIKKEVFLKEREKVKSYQGYTFQVAFLYKAIMDKFKVGEVPIHFADRALGHSKIAPLEYIVNLLTYIITERIYELKRFVKFLIVGGTGFIIQILTQELSILLGIAGFIAVIINSMLTNVDSARDMIGLMHGVGVAIGAESAILSNFMINNFWTFGDTLRMKERSPFIVRLLKFNMTSFGSILIQVLAVWIAENIFGHYIHIGSFTIPTRVAAIVPTIIILVIPLNYFIYNHVIWKTKYVKKASKT
jgi:dolichol-phosphate mannosyltransferase